jgi:hypothetical protein
MTNGGFQDPVGLYSSRMPVLSAESYYVTGPCTFNESVLCANNSAWYKLPFTQPQVMLRTLFVNLIQSATLAKRFRLRAWPLLNVGGVESDSLFRAQVYGSLALGQHGVDYFYWAFDAGGIWNTGCTPQTNCPVPANTTDCWPRTNKSCYPKGSPGLLYPFAKIVNADAKKWGDLLVRATHVGSISTMAITCTDDAHCTAICAGGYPRNTTAVCFEGGCQCILKPDANPIAGPRKPAPNLVIQQMDSNLLVGIFTGGGSGGYLMVVDTRAALSIGAPGTAHQVASLTLSSKCSATIVPPGVERSLESMQFSASNQEAANSTQAQTVSLSLQAGEGALLQVSGDGCADVLRGAGHWHYDERLIAARQLFGRNLMVNGECDNHPFVCCTYI